MLTQKRLDTSGWHPACSGKKSQSLHFGWNSNKISTCYFSQGAQTPNVTYSDAELQENTRMVE